MTNGATPKKRMGTGARIALIIVSTVVVLVVGFGIFIVMGMRSYVNNAKAVEAKVGLMQIGRLAAAAHETSADPGGTKHLCASSTYTVPASMAQVRGAKYQSTPEEWSKDAQPGGQGAGFACLKFEMDQPQYFLYSYVATATDFTASAQGDLNGNGVFSTYTLKGKVVGDKVVVDADVAEQNAGE